MRGDSPSVGATARAGPRTSLGARGSGPRRGIFITGTPRSGTTWVGRMLALDPGLFYAHEPFNNRFRRAFPQLLGEPVRPYFRYVPVGEDYPRVTRFLDFLMGRSEALADVDRSDWSSEEKRFFREIQRHRRRGAAPVVKDPIGVLSMEWMHRRYDVPVLAMVRHPAEFARSMLRLEWDTGPRKLLAQKEFADTLPADLVAEIDACRGPQDPVRKAALMWKGVNVHIHQVASRNPEAIRIIRHEDLAGDPRNGFAGILEWLDMGSGALLDRIEGYCSEDNPDEPPYHWVVRRNSRANRDRWRSYFNEQDLRTIREIVEPMSELFGYSF